MSKNRELLFFVVGLVLANRIFISFYIPGFTISFSVIVLAVFLYIFDSIEPLVGIPVEGMAAALVRGMIEYPLYGSLSKTITMVWPDLLFLLVYAVFFKVFTLKVKRKTIQGFMTIVLCCDFISNLIEMMIRIGLADLDYQMIQSLMVIALLRTLIALVLITLYRYQKTLILKEAHDRRYRQLLLQTSQFKTEVYFMNKNIVEIEDVMKKSFTIYNHLNNGEYIEELKDMALDIAKDVHEIKKDYLQRIKGMKGFVDHKENQSQMEIKDLADVIRGNFQDHEESIQVYIHAEVDFNTTEHYYLTSIVNNLIQNSMDSLANKSKGWVQCTIKKTNTHCVIEVQDSGEGISQIDLNYIFKPGYSSKFDEETGEINRGLGLTLVKDLVENHFGGMIEVDSQLDKGTHVSVRIPINMLVR